MKRVLLSLGIVLAGAGLVLGLKDQICQEASATPTSAPATDAAAPLAASQPGVRASIAAPLACAYHAAVGSQFDYALTAEGATSLRSGTSAAAEVEQRLQGTVRMTVVDRSGDEIVAEVRLQCANPRLLVAGKQLDADTARALARELAQPFLVRMRDDGNTLGFAFVDAMGGQARGTVSALLAGLRLVVPDAISAQWQAEECGQNGAFLAAYRRATGGDIAKAWPAAAVPSPAANDGGVVATGTATGRLDAELGWIERAAFTERQSVRQSTMKIESEGHFAATLTLAEHRTLSRTEIRDLGWDLATIAWTTVQPDARADDGGSNSRLAEHWRRAIGTATTRDLIDRLLQLLRAHAGAQDLTRAELALIWKLRLESGDAGIVAAALTSEGLDTIACDALLRVLGAAGTEPAQNVLAAYVTDALGNEELRARAVVSMVQIEQPVAGLADTLLAVARDAGRSALLRNTALLMVGTLASRSSERGALLDALFGLESCAAAEGRLDTWLRAVANAKADAVGEVAGRYLGHADAGVRIAALQALHDSAQPAASRELASHASTDPSEGVQIAAMQMLATRRDPVARDAIARALATGSEALRAAVLEGLGQSPRDEFAREMLQRIITQDPSPQLRQLARGVAAP